MYLFIYLISIYDNGVDAESELILNGRWSSMRKAKLLVSRQKGKLLGAKKLSVILRTCPTR